jgi:hypothetical protein
VYGFPNVSRNWSGGQTNASEQYLLPLCSSRRTNGRPEAQEKQFFEKWTNVLFAIGRVSEVRGFSGGRPIIQAWQLSEIPAPAGFLSPVSLAPAASPHRHDLRSQQ